MHDRDLHLDWGVGTRTKNRKALEIFTFFGARPMRIFIGGGVITQRRTAVNYSMLLLLLKTRIRFA